MDALFKKIVSNNIIIALFAVLVLWVLYLLRNVITVLFLSFILSSGFLPIVVYARRKRVPRLLAVFLPYALLLIVTIGIIVPLFPLMSSQTALLARTLPENVRSVGNFLEHATGGAAAGNALSERLGSAADALGQLAFSFTGQLISGLFGFITALVISFYILLDHDHIAKEAAELIMPRRPQFVRNFLHDAERALGGWLRAQLILSVTIGALVWASLGIIGVSSAAALALIAAILEFVPYFGPVLAGLAAVIVVLNTSPQQIGTVMFFFVIVQIFEANIIAPQVMRRNINLHPIVIMIGFFAGAELGGVTGALASIPLLTIGLVFYKRLSLKEE